MLIQLTKESGPSALMEYLKLTPHHAQELWGYMFGGLEPISHPAGEARYRECHHPPSPEDMTLHVANAMLGTHGIEGWPNPENFREGISYCNAGDTYGTTLILGPYGNWYVGDWAGAEEEWPSSEGAREWECFGFYDEE